MFTFSRQSLAVFTMVFCAAHSHAEPQTTALTNLPTVVVTASKLPSNEQTTPATITVLAPSPILGDNIADVLGYAGLNAFSQGANKQTTSSFIRGANSNHTLLLVDGIRMNGSVNGLPDYNTILFGQNDHVEVLEGPSSVLYGVNAIGGVVNVVSKAPSKSSARLKLSQGSKHFAAGQLDASLVNGSAYADFSLLSHEQDGSEIVSSSSITDAYKALKGKVTIGGKIRDNIEASLQYHNTDDEGQYVNGIYDSNFAFIGVAPKTYNQRNTLIAQHLKADLGELQYHSKLADVRLKRNEQNGDFTYSTSQQIDQRLNFTPDAGQNTFMIGLDGSIEEGDILSFGTRYKENNDVVGVYGQHTFEHDVLNSQVGARYESNDLWGDTWAGQISGGAKFGTVSQTHFVYLNLGRAFKAPTLNDRYSSSGNPDLIPETSLSAEIGDKTTFKLNSPYISTIQGKWYVYQQQVKELINYSFASLRSENIGKVDIRGLGVQQSVNFSQGASLNGRYELVYAKNADTNAELLRRPRHNATAELNQPLGYNIDLSVNAQYRHAARDFASDYERRAVMGLVLNYALSPQVNISLEGKNLFDAKAQLGDFGGNLFYTAPPRWLGIGLQVKTR